MRKLGKNFRKATMDDLHICNLCSTIVLVQCRGDTFVIDLSRLIRPPGTDLVAAIGSQHAHAFEYFCHAAGHIIVNGEDRVFMHCQEGLNLVEPTQTPAPSILDLFRSWLDHLISRDNPNTPTQANREHALHVLAAATAETPLRVLEATRLLADANCPPATLDELIKIGAVVQHGSTIQLLHDALADYFRAIEVATHAQDLIAESVEEAPLRPDSLFPILLLSLLNQRKWREQLWTRLLCLPLQAYLYVVRYAVGIDRPATLNNSEIAAGLAEDITSGFMLPLRKYFPNLERIVSSRVAGVAADAIQCSATISDDLTWLTYSYSAHPPPPEQQQKSSRRGLNLQANGLSIGSGRLLAATDLLRLLQQVLRSRAVTGGDIWNEEWLLSRLRYLSSISGADLLSAGLDEVEPFLAVHEDAVFPIDDDVPCSVAEVLERVRMLRTNGCNKISAWWPNKPGEINDEGIAAALNEHYRRTQIAYMEVVHCSFSEVLSELAHAQLFPVRWKISITPSALFPNERTLHWTYIPVAEWRDAGADVLFGHAPRFSDFAEQEQAIAARLRELGRSPGRLAMHGFGPLPVFDGSRFNRGYDGETSVLRAASALLEDDITAAFVPVRDARVALMSFLGL